MFTDFPYGLKTPPRWDEEARHELYIPNGIQIAIKMLTYSIHSFVAWWFPAHWVWIFGVTCFESFESFHGFLRWSCEAEQFPTIFSPHQGLILLWCTTRRCASLKNAVGPFAPESLDHALKGGETPKKAHLRALLTQLSGAGGTDACWCYGTGHMVSKRRGEGIFAGRMMSKHCIYTWYVFLKIYIYMIIYK